MIKNDKNYTNDKNDKEQSQRLDTIETLLTFLTFPASKKNKTFLTIENNNLNIHSESSIRSDRGRHWEFLRCLAILLILQYNLFLSHNQYLPYQPAHIVTRAIFYATFN